MKTKDIMFDFEEDPFEFLRRIQPGMRVQEINKAVHAAVLDLDRRLQALEAQGVIEVRPKQR